MERLRAIHGRPVDPWDGKSVFEPGSYMAQLLAGGGSRELLGEPAEVEDVEVCPVEVTGEPGDIVLTHMQVFHAPGPNVGLRPRQMVGNAFRRVELTGDA
jgi:hypothetical protein